MVFDDTLRVVSWNEAAVALTGIAREDALGRLCWEVLHAADECHNAVCHAGCSYARLAREGWPVPTRKLWIKAGSGKRLVSVATVTVRIDERPLFLHLLRNGEVVDARPTGAPAGAPPVLTPRQRDVLGLLADGVPAKVAASRLGLAETTVRNHIRAILVQLGCHSQLEAVAKARRLGILEP
jgi:DNA-binding CsgD family transcriptional regulator